MLLFWFLKMSGQEMIPGRSCQDECWAKARIWWGELNRRVQETENGENTISQIQ